MNIKRKTLKIIAGIGAVASVLPSAWVRPIVSSVVLPAHAQSSGCIGQTWDFKLNFTDISCTLVGICGDVNPSWIANHIKPNTDQRFCLSDREIASEQFNRNIDFDGMGPAADYLFVTYMIETKTESEMSGTVVSLSVDTLLAISGVWVARRVV